MASRWIKRWKVAGSDGKEHTVAQDKDGLFGCSCGKWIYQKFRPRLDCQHISRKKVELIREDTLTRAVPIRTGKLQDSITGRISSNDVNIQEIQRDLNMRIQMSFSDIEKRLMAQMGLTNFLSEEPKKKAEKKPIRAIELEE